METTAIPTIIRIKVNEVSPENFDASDCFSAVLDAEFELSVFVVV